MTEPIRISELRANVTLDRDYGDGYSGYEMAHDALLALIDVAEAAHELLARQGMGTASAQQRLEDALASLDHTE